MGITPQQHFDAGLDQVREDFTDVPAIAACLVRDFGRDRVYGASGIRRAGKSTVVAPTDRFPVGSVAKPVAGLLMARLNQAGILGWDETIGDVFTELRTTAGRAAIGVVDGYEAVTVTQLLTHTSGIYNQGGTPNLTDPPNWPELWFYQDAGSLAEEWLTPEGLMHRRVLLMVQSLQRTPAFAPGQGHGYGPAQTICAAMAERRTGKTFEELYQKYVFGPAGMTQSSWKRTATTKSPPDGPYEHNSDGTPNDVFAQIQGDWKAHAPVGTYNASPRDFAMMIEQHLPAATGASTRLFSDAELTELYPRSGWGTSGASTDLTLKFNGDDGCQYARFVIHPQRGDGYGVTTTIRNKEAVNQMVNYLADMAKNWDTLF